MKSLKDGHKNQGFPLTEAAAVAAVYGIVVGMYIYKSVSMKDLYELLVESAKGSSVVLFIIASASFFAWFLATSGISEAASQLILNVSGSKFVFLLLVNIILLIAGCFVDATSALYIFVPIMLPVALQFGYDPIALGVVMTLNLAIGLITPPVGADLYVACNISKISLGEISKHVMPYVIVSIIVLALITYVPWIITFPLALFGFGK